MKSDEERVVQSLAGKGETGWTVLVSTYCVPTNHNSHSLSQLAILLLGRPAPRPILSPTRSLCCWNRLICTAE